MSWLFSQALVEDCWPQKCLDGKRSVPLSWTGIADAYLSSDKMTDSLNPISQFGMTFVPLTADRGAGELMSYLEDFLVRLTAKPQQGKTLPMIFGLKCEESWQMSLPGTYLPKMSAELQLTKPQTIVNRWVTKPKQLNSQRQTWVQTTFGQDVGYLHTPTTMANFCAPSMQKHAGCRNWVKVFGKITPNHYEWLMGWPIGWTDLKPLEMDKSHYVQPQPGES
jgi:hypothetical protein